MISYSSGLIPGADNTTVKVRISTGFSRNSVRVRCHKNLLNVIVIIFNCILSFIFYLLFTERLFLFMKDILISDIICDCWLFLSDVTSQMRHSDSQSGHRHQISTFNELEKLWRVNSTLWGMWATISAACVSVWMNPAVLQKCDLYSNPSPNSCTTLVLQRHIKPTPVTFKDLIYKRQIFEIRRSWSAGQMRQTGSRMEAFTVRNTDEVSWMWRCWAWSLMLMNGFLTISTFTLLPVKQ